ncbi:hypothetical protein OJ253_636 [Cryptosporidium canis]|uniref:Uncharacterized protein n=1 Tax=Cryptosporidium canis TaxID=195482 RepID=A0A9D5DII3_9CRYT|nr:hypothetical protein OJ253_636 [Cryptosporidium canis]
MNQLSEVNSNERVDQGSNVLTEHSLNKNIPPTTCVSPIMEGKNFTNSYIDSLVNSSQSANQAIVSALSQNIGFGLNMNTGISELSSSFPLILPSNLYQINNMLGAVQAIIPDCYSAITRGYCFNNTIIPHNVIPINGIPMMNFSGLESTICSQNNLLHKEENLSEVNSVKLDSQSPLINPILPPHILSSIGPQIPFINPGILPRVSPMVGSCTGYIGPNSLVGLADQYDTNKFKNSLSSQKRENSVQDESDKLHSLLNSYLSNIASLADAHERVRSYLGGANRFDRSVDSCIDTMKLHSNTGIPDCSLGNIPLGRTSTNNLPGNISQLLTNNLDQSIPGEPNDIFKISHTRKYRLGDQGRALLKSELSAYLRNHPEKRAEASKIADIRNATTKQLWQIAAMCGLEERFINLHAQSLAQSKGRAGPRGTKRKPGTNIELSKASGQVGNGEFESPSATESSELDQKVGIPTPTETINNPTKVPSYEDDVQVKMTEDKSADIEGKMSNKEPANENLDLRDAETKDNSIISADSDAKRIKVDTSDFI